MTNDVRLASASGILWPVGLVGPFCNFYGLADRIKSQMDFAAEAALLINMVDGQSPEFGAPDVVLIRFIQCHRVDNSTR